MSLSLTEWVDVLDKEYLAEFVPAGGASVKIVTAPPGAQNMVMDRVAEVAGRRNCTVARLRADETKIQFIEHAFFAIARQIDWMELAHDWLREQFIANGVALAPEQRLEDLDAIAGQMGVEPREVVGEVRRWIVNGLLKDHQLTREFRTAMALLCQAVINPINVSPSDSDVLLQWLRGGKYSLSTLKKLQIFTRIGRHNARQMLTSLSRWLHTNGRGGLVVLIDASTVWLPVTTTGDTAPPTIRYSRNATLDFFEVLRQFIDEVDDLEHFLLVVGVPPTFWSDPKKGISQYTALQMRVVDEVRDRDRANPLGTAVRLDVPMEVGA
ncbi:hypothetical protein IAD21_06309 [Abditibacteriota bacterium]|nr:hypothetical protein IAD21_06309 [Abditibacteriota bacterium]